MFSCGIASTQRVTILRFNFVKYEVVSPNFNPGVLPVWLAVELFAALYVASFAWFWQLCRSSARRELTRVREEERPSNLIPFERGLEMHLRKHPTAI
jgi:hypothetical protein